MNPLKHRNNSMVEIGAKYGRLTIVENLGTYFRNGVKRTKVKTTCECGNEYIGYFYIIKSGGIKSCGCLRKEMAKEWGRERSTKHGKSDHPLMSIWSGMVQRCTNPNNKAYHNYGAKGIKVCDEWLNSYENFYNWAIENGWAKGLQLDKDVIPKQLSISPKEYSPKYCSFVTRAQNNRAKKNNINIVYNGIEKCLFDWAKDIGVEYGTLKYRIDNWSIEQALTTPKIKRYAERIKTR